MHYINFDRRLDEWVNFDRIDTTSLVPSSELVQDKISKDSSFKGKKHNKVRRTVTFYIIIEHFIYDLHILSDMQ